jgi:ankyrin repeat protein
MEFDEAFALVEAHDVDGLRAAVGQHPELLAAVGKGGNDLLAFAAGTCDERLVRVLLDAGADVHRGNAHGWTPLHQAGYANLPLMARLLLDAGARVDVSARGDGGTPLAAALFWGHREVAELLAVQGIHPPNLRVAAGLGDLSPALDPGAGREFYRPHSGFPEWRPSDDPQELLDEALSWAARSARVEVLGELVERGARLDAEVYRGTALAWAASRGRVAAVARLLALGANPDQRTGFGGPTHGNDTTALHLAAESGHLDVIRALLDAGADVAVHDATHDSTPAGWAEHSGHTDAVALLQR